MSDVPYWHLYLKITQFLWHSDTAHRYRRPAAMVIRWGRGCNLKGRGQSWVTAASHQQRCVWEEKEKEKEGMSVVHLHHLLAWQCHLIYFFKLLQINHIVFDLNSKHTKHTKEHGRGWREKREDSFLFSFGDIHIKQLDCFLLKWASGRLRGFDEPLRLPELSKRNWKRKFSGIRWHLETTFKNKIKEKRQKNRLPIESEFWNCNW